MPENSEPQADRDELHTVAARAQVRQSLETDIEAFLAQGGVIQDVPDDQQASV